MVAYQHDMADAARQLANGDLAVKVNAKSTQDVLGNAFSHMITYQREVADAVGQVAKGDLTINVQPISDEDVLGNSVQKMIAHLRQTVGSVQLNAGRLLSASRYLSTTTEQANGASAQIAQTIEMMAETTQQVAQTIGQVAVGAAQQAQVMDHSRHIMEDQDRLVSDIAQGALQQSQSIEAADHVFSGRLATAIQQVENATIASDHAVDTAAQAARSGTDAVEKTITGFNTVAKTADQVTRRIGEMGRRSNQIGAIVQVINDIAERTNLLSLNAAIEAARAGEHGKGFAVVADEVRKLADRSARSAEEISQLVTTVQDAANQAVAAMEENDRQVQQGLATAGDAEEALSGIRSSMAQVGLQMKQLQGAVADLSGSSLQVQEAMQQVAGVIEENLNATSALTAGQKPLQQSMEEIASVAEENSAAAEEVAASAEENSASVEEISAMTKNVNIQVQQMHDAVQSLTSMSTDLQAIVATFQMGQWDSASDLAPQAAGGHEQHQPYSADPAMSPVSGQRQRNGASAGKKRRAAFVWDETMATGDEKVDEQHRMLFDMTNGLLQALSEGKGRQHIAEVLDRLEAYTKEHFAWEEHCMEEHHCPVAEVNKTAHARFVQMVAETRQRFEKEGPSTELVLAIKENLGDWLVKHIRRIDTNLRGCVQSKKTVAAQHK
ncbi:MAG: bacteriohemerythrin [Caldilineaceae bacterium]